MKVSFFLGCMMLAAPVQTGAITFARMTDSVNNACGAVYHSVAKTLWGYTDTPLNPENEAFARDLVDKMKLKKAVKFYALPASQKKMGPHCVFNRIYLDEDEMKTYANRPEVALFTIGHELIHAEKSHSLQWLALYFVATECSDYLFKKAWTRLGIRKKADNTGIPLLGRATSLIPSLLASGVGVAFVKYSKKSYEKEADLLAQKLLAPTYGAETIAQGAATCFADCTSFEPYSRCEKWFAEHPHPKERLRYLGISEEDTKASATKLIDEYKMAVVRMLGTSCAAHLPKSLEADKSDVPCPVNTWWNYHRYGYLDNFGMRTRHLQNRCTIHPSAAQEVVTFLQGKELTSLLKSAVAYLRDAVHGAHNLKGFSLQDQTNLATLAKWLDQHPHEAKKWLAEVEENLLFQLSEFTAPVISFLSQHSAQEK